MDLKNLLEEFVSLFNSDKTRKAYLKDVTYFMQKADIVTVRDLTSKKIVAFRDQEKAKGSAPASIARRLSSIKSFCNFLRAKRILTEDVFIGVAFTKIYRIRPTEALTDEEAKKIIKAADKKGPLRDRILLRFMLQLGLRRSELENLKASDVYEYEKGMWAVNVIGKGEKQREIALRSDIADMVKQLGRADNELLFGVSGTHINNIIKKYCKMVGITKRISAHSCRATVISHLLENREPLRNVAAMAGHSNVNTTMIYDKKRDGLKNSAALKVKY